MLWRGQSMSPPLSRVVWSRPQLFGLVWRLVLLTLLIPKAFLIRAGRIGHCAGSSRLFGVSELALPEDFLVRFVVGVPFVSVLWWDGCLSLGCLSFGHCLWRSLKGWRGHGYSWC